MSCRKIFERIEELYETYLSFWEDVCNIESPTNFKEGVDKVGDYFAAEAVKMGWTVEKFTQPVSGDVVCITMNPESEGQPVCVSAHMDTVHPVGMFGTPAVRRDDEKIYGPGVIDCKGGAVAGFLAMAALADCGFDARPVRLLLQSDEEGSSKTSGKATIRYICERSKDAAAFLNLEGSTKPDIVTVSRKGIVTYRFDITGIEGHSASCAAEGANAIVEASHKIIELDKLKDADGITCNCAIISGGTVVNTIPGKCSFSANFRFATQEQLRWINDYVHELADKSYVKGCSCEVEQVAMRVAMELEERNIKLADRINEILAENDLPILEKRHGLGGADASDVSVYGIPCVDSIGVLGGGTHSIDEFAYLRSLAESAKRLVAIICGL